MMLELAGIAPREVILVGIVPDRVGPWVGLSDPVKDAIPRVIEQVLAHVHAHGAEVIPRLPFVPPDIWWERPPADIPSGSPSAEVRERLCTS